MALLLGAATAAAAQSRQTAVVVLGIEAQDAPEPLARELTDALRQRAAGLRDHSVVAGKSLMEVKLVFGCVDEAPACMAHAAKVLGADKMLYGTLRRTPTGLKVQLKWLDVATARVENRIDEPVPTEAANTGGMRTLGVKWFAGLAGVKTTGAIQLTTTTAGAQIFLDGRALGVTSERPLTVTDVSAGVHQVRLEKAGFKAVATRVRVSPGEVAQVAMRLEAEEPPQLVRREGPEQPIKENPIPIPKPVDTGTPETPGRGWRIAFLSSAAATVVLGTTLALSGAHVLSLQDDWKSAATAWQGGAGYPAGTTDKGGICSAATAAVMANPNNDRALSVKQVCDDGDTWATTTNVLVAATILAGVASAGFYYKGYLEGPSDRGGAAQVNRSSSRLRVSPELFGAARGGGIVAEFEF